MYNNLDPQTTHQRAIHHTTNTSSNNIIIPDSTPGRIVFPFNAISRKFETSHYTPVMTNNRAGLAEIQEFLSELETNLHSLKQRSVQNYILIGFCLLVVMIIIIGVVDTSLVSNNPTSNLPATMFGIFGGCLFIFICSVCFFIIRYVRLLKKSVEFARNYANKKGNLFAQRGLNWIIPIHYPHWIELWTNGEMTVMTYQTGSERYYQPPPLDPVQQMQLGPQPQFSGQQQQFLNQQPQFINYQSQGMNQGYYS